MPDDNASQDTAKPGSSIRHDPEEEKLHSFHRFGDIKLIAKDGITLMANSERLSVSTWLMEGMGGMTPSDDKEIDMSSFSSAAISCFLDLINVAIPREPIAKLPVLFELFTLHEQHGDDDENIRKLIEGAIYQAAQVNNRQWSFLLFAKDYYDEHGSWFCDVGVNLVKSAIRVMTKEAFLFPKTLDGETGKFKQVGFWQAIDILPSDWKDQLLRLTIIMPNFHNGHGDIQVTCDWDKVADDFKPYDD